ncbi:Protein of uncharacterised function (DUF3182) [Bordetella ansorpii]|uniref:Protein of uncharacterized function (DUF3182) n=1 Tax=Bordetella ansorpii TaxID=288768 RepID=A0A157MDS8_9BORD|nr:DUF3182 family protein [Bordetella ansorpii]SAI06960.1 Protein of uncharacterised function (DUF3182) [Bordetella ansorpii]
MNSRPDSRAGAAPHLVVAHPRRPSAPEHEIASHCVLAQRLAGLLGAGYAEYDPAMLAGKRVYYVPAHTLVGQAQADALGITAEDHLYGGVVPHAYVATKAVSHPLHRAHDAQPPGWAAGLGAELGDAVLPGYTAFSLADASAAALALLQDGPIRLKLPEANAGRGQTVVRDAARLQAVLAGCDPADVRAHGLVIEMNLIGEVLTFSVGSVRIPGLRAAYVGTQELTPDNSGASVYGGSTLRVVRGGYDELLNSGLSDDERQAVHLARHYDACVQRHYPSILASRRNYDVALGADAQGMRRMGVLEQSWRAGGASLAEIAALEALASDPALHSVTAHTRERYGAGHPRPPEHALVFHAEDSTVGFISKSGGITAYGGAK